MPTGPALPLAALYPGLRACGAQGCSGDMPVGRGFTAAWRQASRLAGLVRFPASWQVHTAIRRRASWLAKKASVVSNPRWPQSVKKVEVQEALPPAGVIGAEPLTFVLQHFPRKPA